ncbi:flagellar biosynthetic protein FliR, partial [Klebsiella pneumoniae]
QLLIGAAMGFTMRLAITAVEVSGAIIAMQMGLGFAMQFDPGSGAQVSSVSRLLTLFTYLILLAINGHHVMLGTLVESFTLLPVSLAPLPAMSL